MSILHTVNKSPFQKNDLSSCLAHANAGDAVLLIEDGVYGAISGTQAAAQVAGADASVFVLGGDLAARGISEDKLAADVKIVSYDDFVDMAVEHQTVNAWL